MAKDEFDRDAKAPETKPRKPVKDEDGQFELIDVDHPADKEIKSLATRIRKLDRERGEAQGKADELREKLRAIMHDNKIKHWAKGDFEIVLRKTEEKVSVRSRAKKGAEESEDDDGGPEE